MYYLVLFNHFSNLNENHIPHCTQKKSTFTSTMLCTKTQ